MEIPKTSPSSLDTAFALLDHLKTLTASLPEAKSKPNTQDAKSSSDLHFSQLKSHLNGFQDADDEKFKVEVVRRLRERQALQLSREFQLPSKEEQDRINKIISGYVSSRPSIDEILKEIPITRPNEPTLLLPKPVVRAMESNTALHSPASLALSSPRDETDMSTKPPTAPVTGRDAPLKSGRQNFAAEFQAALDAKMSESEVEFQSRLAIAVKQAKEEGISQGMTIGERDSVDTIRVLQLDVKTKTSEVHKLQDTLKQAHLQQAKMEVKVANVRGESQRAKSMVSQFGGVDPTEAEKERSSLEAERDYYYKLSFRTVDDDLKLLGSTSAAEHQKQQLLQLQQRQKEEAERKQLQQKIEILEKRNASTVARFAVYDGKISKIRSKYINLKTILELQNRHTMEFQDEPAEDTNDDSVRSKHSRTSSFVKSTDKKRRQSSVSGKVDDQFLANVITDLNAVAMYPNTSALHKQLALILKDWVAGFTSSDRPNAKYIVSTLAEIGTSALAGPRRNSSGKAIADAAVQAAPLMGSASSHLVLAGIQGGLQHLHESALKVSGAQGRFLDRLKSFLVPSRVSRSVPKVSLESIMDPATLAAYPDAEQLARMMQQTESSLLLCIHKLASYEVKPPAAKSKSGTSAATASGAAEGHGDDDEVTVTNPKHLTEAQRRKRWLMIKSTALMEEAVQQSALERSEGGGGGGSGHKHDNQTAVGPQGKVAIVFTDIQSSTLLWQLYSDKMSDALKAHNRILREAITTHNGYEVKTIGDAFMIAFGSPQDAMDYCMCIQEHLMKHSWDDVFNKAVEVTMTRVLEDSGEVPRYSLWNGLRVRVGIHYGEPLSEFDTVTRRTDYFGPMVNLSARVQGVAFGGQTLISQAVFDAINLKDIPTSCVVGPGGTHSLKGIDNPVKLFSIMPAQLTKRDADFAEQVRQKVEKLGTVAMPPPDPTIERFTSGSRLLTFVVVVCQRLPELSDDQWNFCLALVLDAAKTTSDLCHGYISKQTSTVIQIAFEKPTDALRFGSLLQMSCVKLDYGDDVAELTDYITTSPGGTRDIILYRGINPKIGIHQFSTEGEFDVFSNRVIFQQSDGLAVVGALALNARLGEILISDEVRPFVDDNALKSQALPSPIVVPSANPIHAHVLVPSDLAERIQMRPEFAPEDLHLDEELDGEDPFKEEDPFAKTANTDCMKCGRAIGPLCVKCVAIECKSCRKEFHVPKRCPQCSSSHSIRRNSKGNDSPQQQTPNGEISLLELQNRSVSAGDLIAAVHRSSSSRSLPISQNGSPKPPVPLHPTFLGHFGSSGSLARTESGRFNKSVDKSMASSSTNLANLSINGSTAPGSDGGSIARSRLQNALRHRLGATGSSSNLTANSE